MGNIDGLLVEKNRGFDITCLPHMGEIEMVRDQISTSAPPTLYWGVGLGIDRCIRHGNQFKVTHSLIPRPLATCITNTCFLAVLF